MPGRERLANELSDLSQLIFSFHTPKKYACSRFLGHDGYARKCGTDYSSSTKQRDEELAALQGWQAKMIMGVGFFLLPMGRVFLFVSFP